MVKETEKIEKAFFTSTEAADFLNISLVTLKKYIVPG